MGIFKSQKGFAHILIVLLALVLIGTGFYFYTTRTKNVKMPDIGNIVKTTQPLTLNLESPNSNTVAVDNQVLIKGKTLPNTIVVIFNETDEATLESDQNGNFEGILALGEGRNTVTVTAFGDNGTEKTLAVDIDYQPET